MIRALILLLAAALPAAGRPASPSSWTLPLYASAGAGDGTDSLAAFGVDLAATAGYDAGFDTPHPPPPPGSFVELYFPHSGGGWPPLFNALSHDISAPSSPWWVFNLMVYPDSALVALSWDASPLAALPAGYHIFLRDSTDGTVVDMRASSGYTRMITGHRLFSIRVVDIGTSVAVGSRWNLVSLPCTPLDSSAQALFPHAVSQAFAYSGTYQIAATLRKGVGYWLKFNAPDTVALPGEPLLAASVDLVPGWNLIGSIAAEVPAPSGGIVVSRCFAYAGSYVTASTIVPGAGYWVKASTSGTISLSPAAALPKLTRPSDVTMTFTDGDCPPQTLMLGEVDDPALEELPPMAPGDPFDVRYAGGADRVPAAAGGVYRAIVTNRHGEVHARVSAAAPGIRVTIDGAQEAAFAPGVHEISIAVAREMPRAFALHQNYPNPFNPSTRISFDLPGRAHVRLAVVDILGREVAVPAEGEMEGGAHALTFDASGLAAGAYLYRLTALTAGGAVRTDVRRLMILK